LPSTASSSLDGLAFIIAGLADIMVSFAGGMASLGFSASSKRCSIDAVRAAEICVNAPVSKPNAIATAATTTATPTPRLTHSPAPSDCFMAMKMRPPARRARARDVAAPAA
jgi:hypothetical protein